MLNFVSIYKRYIHDDFYSRARRIIFENRNVLKYMRVAENHSTLLSDKKTINI